MVDGPPQPADDDTNAQQRRRLTWRLIGAGLLVLGLLVILLLACVLWIPRWLYPPLTDNDLKDVKTAQNELDAAKVQELKDARLKLQNDARTTLLQGLGALLLLTGAGIGATVTLRQVKVSQEGLHATREQMQHTLETTRQQLNLTEQGQVTDRYTRAVEQLGHEKAPVRLGALYSLEHLAQDNPQYRQTVVEVVCAYLRMPYTLPAGQDPAWEELQVRQTAQRLLANHLRWPPATSGQDAQLLQSSPEQVFWPGISLDLTDATLVDFAFDQVSVVQVQFVGATFEGGAAVFGGATFEAAAVFSGATFKGVAVFEGATFKGGAWFVGATFQFDAAFIGATFQEDARFNEATFKGDAAFGGATFQRDARFDEATFKGGVSFVEATFQRDAGFGGATFQRDAGFGEATFQGDAVFDGATFQGDARFGGATFQGDARFAEAIIQGDARFAEAHVLHFNRRYRHHVWPDGWMVLPDRTDPSRGTLVYAEHAKEPKSAAPPSDHTDNR